MKKLLLTISIIVVSIIIYSCTENPVINAELIDAEELKYMPGFVSWYEIEVDAYKPLDSCIQSIKSNYNPSTDQFLIYVKPSCACTGTYKQFPAFMKIMSELGIAKQNYKVYSMTSEFNYYPEKELFKIKTLPSFMLLRNGMPIYSVADTLNFYDKTIDSLRLEQVLQSAYKLINK